MIGMPLMQRILYVIIGGIFFLLSGAIGLAIGAVVGGFIGMEYLASLMILGSLASFAVYHALFEERMAKYRASPTWDLLGPTKEGT